LQGYIYRELGYSTFELLNPLCDCNVPEVLYKNFRIIWNKIYDCRIHERLECLDSKEDKIDYLNNIIHLIINRLSIINRSLYNSVVNYRNYFI